MGPEHKPFALCTKERGAGRRGLGSHTGTGVGRKVSALPSIKVGWRSETTKVVCMKYSL